MYIEALTHSIHVCTTVLYPQQPSAFDHCDKDLLRRARSLPTNRVQALVKTIAKPYINAISASLSRLLRHQQVRATPVAARAHAITMQPPACGPHGAAVVTSAAAFAVASVSALATAPGILSAGSARRCRALKPAFARQAATLATTRRVAPWAAADRSTSGPANHPPSDDGAGGSAGGGGSEDQYDIPQSDVDWNAEWSRFTSAGMVSDAPKGREPPSRSAKVAMKAVSTVQASMNNVTNNMPSREVLFADWRFWVGLILALSVFTAAVGSSQSHHPSFI
jgi:hypothetical protein